MHACKFLCPWIWLFPAMPGGRVLPMMAPPEIPGGYSTNIFTGKLRPEVQPPYPSRKRSIFVTYSYFMTVHFQQLKGIQSSKQGMWKEYHLSIEGVRNQAVQADSQGHVWHYHELMSRVCSVRRLFLTEGSVVLVSIYEIAYTVS